MRRICVYMVITVVLAAARPLFCAEPDCAFDKGNCSFVAIIQKAKGADMVPSIPGPMGMDNSTSLNTGKSLQSPHPSAVVDVYDFPVKPGMEEWKAFASHEEMLKACQIPEPLLRKMSTAALVETVLNYPLYWTTIISNSAGTQQGFSVLVSQFNGIQELLKRKDAGSELLLKYHFMPPPKKEGTDMEIGDYLFYGYSMEILFAQNPIRAGLTETQIKELKKELLVKYEIKNELKEAGGLSKEIMTLLTHQYNLPYKIHR